jgi:hypothetical protein
LFIQAIFGLHFFPTRSKQKQDHEHRKNFKSKFYAHFYIFEDLKLLAI